VEIVKGKTSDSERVETWTLALTEQLADQKLVAINSDGLWELGPNFKLGEPLEITSQHGEIGPITTIIWDKERRAERNQRSRKRMAIVQLQHEITKLFDRAIDAYSEDSPPQEEATKVIEKIDETVIAFRALIAGETAAMPPAHDRYLRPDGRIDRFREKFFGSISNVCTACSCGAEIKFPPNLTPDEAARGVNIFDESIACLHRGRARFVAVANGSTAIEPVKPGRHKPTAKIDLDKLLNLKGLTTLDERKERALAIEDYAADRRHHPLPPKVLETLKKIKPPEPLVNYQENRRSNGDEL
jgi:hypothetical protein